MAFVGYLRNGEKDDFGVTFGARMPSGITAANWGWWVPVGISALASAISGNSALTVRLQSTAPGYVYAVSAWIDTSNGRRLIEEIEVHVG